MHEKAMEEERLALEAMKKKKYQTDVLNQISSKEEDKKRTTQQKMLDKREAMMTEMEFKKKLQLENEKNSEKLEKIKTQTQFHKA
jgi:hypothetical protein